MGEFGDYDLTARMAEAISRIATNVVNKIRPQDEFGIVQNVDYTARSATVLIQGDTDPISLPCADFVMPLVGDMVRIAVKLGKMKIVAIEQTPGQYKTKMMQDLIVRGKLTTYAYSASEDTDHDGAEGVFVYDSGVGMEGTGKGGLIAAMSAQSGTDPDGGWSWGGGVTTQSLNLKDAFDPMERVSILAHYYNEFNDKTTVVLSMRGQDVIAFVQDVIQAYRPIEARGGLKLGSGPLGKYYYEELTNPGGGTPQSVAASALTVLANWQASALVADYPSGMASNGSWIAPVDGVYTFSLAVRYTAGTAGSRTSCQIYRNGTLLVQSDISATTVNMAVATGITARCVAGDVVNFRVLQVSGASRAVDPVTFVSIYRNT